MISSVALLLVFLHLYVYCTPHWPASASGWLLGCSRCFFLPARALRDASASLRKYAFLACSARRDRSAGSSTPSGSTSRSNRDKKAARAEAVCPAGSLSRAWSKCAAILARNAQSLGLRDSPAIMYSWGQNSSFSNCLTVFLPLLRKVCPSSGAGAVKAGRRPPRSGMALTARSPAYPPLQRRTDCALAWWCRGRSAVPQAAVGWEVRR